MRQDEWVEQTVERIVERLTFWYERGPSVSSADPDSATIQLKLGEYRKLYIEVTPGHVEGVSYDKYTGTLEDLAGDTAEKVLRSLEEAEPGLRP